MNTALLWVALLWKHNVNKLLCKYLRNKDFKEFSGGANYECYLWFVRMEVSLKAIDQALTFEVKLRDVLRETC